MISLSFDTDHMSEARMREFLKNCPLPGKGTFFCTQPYDALNEMTHELAPHPYMARTVDWVAELNRKREEFPKAGGWRSHSCVFSHIIAEWLAFNGYVYASTFECFGHDNLVPIRNQWGIWQMPIYYMDNLDFSRGRFWPSRGEKPFSRSLIDAAVNGDGCYVFDFHPVHLLLNSPTPEWYAERRPAFIAGGDLKELRYPGAGTFTFYCDLIDAMERKSLKSHTMMDTLLFFAPDAKVLDTGDLSYHFEESKLNA